MTHEEAAYFGAAEITLGRDGMTLDEEIEAPIEGTAAILGEPTIEALIEQAKNCNGGTRLFANYEERVIEALNAAFPPYRRLLRKNEQDLEASTQLKHFPGRRRRPSKSNIALIAIALAAKPQNKAERKACSEYANYYLWAEEQKLSESEFLPRARETPLQDIKSQQRARRRATAGASPPVCKPMLEIKIVGPSGSFSSKKELPIDAAAKSIEHLNSASGEASVIELIDSLRGVLAQFDTAPDIARA